MDKHKKLVSVDDGRRRREDTRIQIRKTKKNEQLLKKRSVITESTIAQFEDKDKYFTTDLPMLVGQIRNGDSDFPTLVKSVRGIRRMLSVSTNPPVADVIQAGAIAPLIAVLSRLDCGELVFEAAWALTNIASTDFTCDVVEAGVIEPMVVLLRSVDENVREQAAWCLGNISGDGAMYRDMVLKANALPSLLLNVEQPANETLLANVTWSISNLCRGKPQPDLALIAPALPGLAWLLNSLSADETMKSKHDMLADVLWALSYASDGDDERIQAVMDTDCTKIVVKILDEGNPKLLTPALRTAGNFVTGNAQQTQAVIDAGVLEIAVKLLQYEKRAIRKETCWLLSNISAGTQSQIGSVFKQRKIIQLLVENAKNEGWDVRKEAIWSVSNIFTGGNDFHVQSLVQADGLEAMCNVLDIPGENRLVVAALDAIENILVVGERNNQDFVTLLDQYGGIDKIEALQQHTDDTIYNKAINMIERFFGEEEVEDENLAPAINGNVFSFGAPAPKNLFGSQGQMRPVAAPFDFSTVNTRF